jgi:hypothetical protein
VEIQSIPVEERELMARRLSSAALVVVLSEFETQPAAMLGALALGRPAIIADTSGLSELAEQGHCPHDSGRRHGSIRCQHRSRGAPRTPICPREKLPTWDQCIASLTELYRSVISDREARTGDSATRR